jgi:hypothetical protein
VLSSSIAIFSSPPPTALIFIPPTIFPSAFSQLTFITFFFIIAVSFVASFVIF